MRRRNVKNRLIVTSHVFNIVVILLVNAGRLAEINNVNIDKMKF